MNAPIDPTLADTLARTFAKYEDNPGAQALVQDLRKVLATPGSRTTDLRTQAAAMAANKTFTQRAADAVKYMIAGVVPTTWFGPNQPLQPQADKPEQGTRGRRFDFQVGSNIQFLPKTEMGAGVPYYVLRALAENYDLLRLVIETRKDQLCAMQWNIVPADAKTKPTDISADIAKATAFFEQPTPDLTWDEWFRQIADDDLVCGAIALYPRMNRGGQLHSLLPMDVAMIKRLIDPSGLTPDAPSPAYQQVLKGVPAVDYTRDELIYLMRNPRTWRLYGYSPVEQIITTVNIALRRQTAQLEYYTEGNIPDMILGVPDTWNPEQIKEVQDIWDSKLSGNTAQRRRLQLVPEMKGVVMPKDAAVMLKDEADEWFARIICFAFSIPPSSLMKQVNRASGQQMAETAKEEGLMPMLQWYDRKLTWIVQNVLGIKNVKFSFKTSVEVDPQVKAETNSLYVRNGIMTPDEAREDIGREPRGVDDLLVYLADGVTPLKESAESAKENLLNPPPPPPAPGLHTAVAPAAGGEGGGEPPAKDKVSPALAAKDKTKEGGATTVGKYLGKALKPTRRTTTSAALLAEERRVTSAINSILRKAGRRLGARAGALLGKATSVEQAIIDRILEQLDAEGVSVQILDELTPTIERLFRDAGIKAVASIDLNEDAAAVAVDQLDGAAVAFIEEHGTELMDGLSSSTRERLKSTIGEAVVDGWSSQRLATAIEESGAFAASRAMTIARTEVAYAHVQGNLAGWLATGQVDQKRWIVGDGCCDACQDLDGVIVAMDEDFDYEDGPIDAPPAHPNCRCDVEPILATDDNEEEQQ